MTYFALTLWVWQQTESATAIALILFFYQLPQIVVSLLSGILVDRVSRKHLLILSDIASAGCTISVGILAAFQVLQLWHIYLIAAVIGCFGNLQSLTYSTLVPLIVPEQHYTRASSLGGMVAYAAGIFSPAFAGVLYPTVGLLGITAIDMGTFAIALFTLLPLPIPHVGSDPDKQDTGDEVGRGLKLWRDTTLGFRYLASQPSLRAMVIIMSSFAFLNQISEVLYQPLILAKTGNNTQILGFVVAMSGMGGVVGAIALSLWGGFRRRVLGMVVGFIGIGLSNLVLGMGQGAELWAIARFGASLFSPLTFSSYTAIWYAKVAPTLQGRVFAADYLIGIVIEASAGLSAGLLADQVFEPALQPGGSLSRLMGGLFGVGAGAGISLLYVLCSLAIVLIGTIGFWLPRLHQVEELPASIHQD